MKIVITGGAGFIGSHLCDFLLHKGHSIMCIDNLLTGNIKNIEHLFGNPNFSFIKHDVTNYIHVRGKVDAVLHFASPASPVDYLKLPIQTLKVGALGTHKTLGLAKEKKAIFMLASTSEVYGDPIVNPQKEDYWGNVNPIGVRSCYDEGKRVAETLMMDYHRQNNVDTRIARIFNTYGPRMLENDGRVVSNFIVQALRGEELTVYGSGAQTRSFCYVDDLVEGLIRLMNAEAEDVHLPVNLGNPGEFTIRELAEEVARLCGREVRIKYCPLPQDDPKQRRPDITRAERLLGWRPIVPLREGLQKTIAYFAERSERRTR